LAVVTGFALNAEALADECWPDCVKVYRAIDLGPLGSPSALGIPFTLEMTYAINRHGDVVWFVQDFGATSGVPIRSFVRVSENKFGLSRLVAYELLPPSSLSDRTVAIATDINDDGWIVGYVGSSEDVTSAEALYSDIGARAVIWRLDLASGSPPLIPAYNAHPAQVLTTSGSEATDCSSVLHAVNNDSPPMVPVPTGCSSFNSAADGLGWGFGSPTPVELLELGYPIDRGRTQARGVVTGGQIVGGSALPIGISQLCHARASYWASASSTAVDLWDVCGGGDEPNQAEAIVEAAGIVPESALAVAGGTQEGVGLLWLDRFSGGWCCNRLSDITVNAIPAVPNTPLIVRYGHDVAESGQLVVDVRVTQQVGTAQVPVPHAALLTCVFDLDGDLRVNGADLGILLNNWGTWNDVLDLTCDGFIDGADLGALLNAWTGDALCRVGLHVIDCHCEQAAEASQNMAMAFDTAVTLAGFDSVAAFVEWGQAATLPELESMAMFIAAIMLTNGPVTE